MSSVWVLMNCISMPLPANIINRPTSFRFPFLQRTLYDFWKWLDAVSPILYQGKLKQKHHLHSPLKPAVEVEMRTLAFYFYMVCFGLWGFIKHQAPPSRPDVCVPQEVPPGAHPWLGDQNSVSCGAYVLLIPVLKESKASPFSITVLSSACAVKAKSDLIFVFLLFWALLGAGIDIHDWEGSQLQPDRTRKDGLV